MERCTMYVCVNSKLQSFMYAHKHSQSLKDFKNFVAAIYLLQLFFNVDDEMGVMYHVNGLLHDVMG